MTDELLNQEEVLTVGKVTEVKKIAGGPKREAFGNDKVVPITFAEQDNFWDIGAKLNNIEDDVRKGKIQDLMIITREEDGLTMYWRGESPMTTGLGMLAWTERQLLIPDD